MNVTSRIYLIAFVIYFENCPGFPGITSNVTTQSTMSSQMWLSASVTLNTINIIVILERDLLLGLNLISNFRVSSFSYLSPEFSFGFLPTFK